MTPSELVEYTRRRYNAEGDTFWSDEELYGLIYEAHLELARETLCIERVYSTVSVAGQREYSFPTNTIAIKRVEYNGQKLVPVTFREDDAMTMLNASTSERGNSQFYSVWDETLFLRPLPDTSALTIKIFSYNEPQEVTNTSVLEVPSRYHLATVDYMLSEMLAKDKDFNGAERYLNKWKNTVERARAFEKKKRRGDSFNAVQDVETLNERIIGNV